MLLAITAILLPLFVLSSLASFPKIRLDEDGVRLETGFSSFFFSFDEVKAKNCYVIRLGNHLIGDWCIPINRKLCLKILEKRGIFPPAIPGKKAPTYVIYLAPPFILYVISFSLKILGIMLNPIMLAAIWGVTVTGSLSMFAYKAPMNVKIWKFDKKWSAVFLGTLLGISIFLFLVLTL